MTPHVVALLATSWLALVSGYFFWWRRRLQAAYQPQFVHAVGRAKTVKDA
jgi:hypothetical protein